MSEVLRLSWAIARSGWQADWNRSFRFSRVKSGLIWLILQAGFILLIARKATVLPGGAQTHGPWDVLALMAVQMAWFGLVFGFARGQSQLYQGILVPLFQVSPARPMAFLIGRVLEAVPNRAWSMLLWGWLYAGLLPQFPRWAAMLPLAAFGLAVGMAAHLSGLLMLTVWGRLWPRTMRNGTIFFGVVTVAFVTWAAIYLSRGGTVTELALTIRNYRLLVGTAVAILGGVPGLVLFAAFFLNPRFVEDLYRRGVYNVVELNEGEVIRPTRSAWLPVGRGVLRAVLSREWLQLTRARITRIQFVIWLASVAGVYATGQAVAGRPLPDVLLHVGGVALGGWFLAYGHWVVRAFETERVTIALYRLAAVSTPQLLFAKFLSVTLPSATLVAASTLSGAHAAGLDPNEALRLLGPTLLSLAAGVAGGFGAAAATVGEAEDPETTAGPRRDLAAAPPGQTNAWYAVARTGALLVSMALAVWTAAGHPGLPVLLFPGAVLWGAAVLLPALLLVAGAWIMIRSWDAI